MYRKAATLMLTAVSPAAACQRRVEGIEYSLDESRPVAGFKTLWHDIHLTNRSGRDLHEVRLTLTLVGEDGSPRAEQKYYALWPEGQRMMASLSRENSPVNVQKVSLTGECAEGRINYAWTTAKSL